MVDRGLYLTFRASAEERAMLKELAEKDGISSSDWVRLAIRRSHEAAIGPVKPKRPKR